MQNLERTEDLQSLIVERRALHVTVARTLRKMIVEGILPAGGRLNERLLCEQLQVSRTPLREALKVLAADGMVELLPNRGAVVALLSEDRVKQTFELLGALEALAGELACQRITEAELAEIKAQHFEMLACHARHDRSNYYKINQRIHDLINAAARNPLLNETYLRLNLRTQALRFRTNTDREKWDQAVQEHTDMLGALERRDAAAIGEVMRRHLMHKMEVALAQVRQQREQGVSETADAAQG